MADAGQLRVPIAKAFPLDELAAAPADGRGRPRPRQGRRHRPLSTADEGHRFGLTGGRRTRSVNGAGSAESVSSPVRIAPHADCRFTVPSAAPNPIPTTQLPVVAPGDPGA